MSKILQFRDLPQIFMGQQELYIGCCVSPSSLVGGYVYKDCVANHLLGSVKYSKIAIIY